jgi:hypothetical protein
VCSFQDQRRSAQSADSFSGFLQQATFRELAVSGWLSRRGRYQAEFGHDENKVLATPVEGWCHFATA